jgi:phosphatidylglycerol:prolipoprotein diacylglycerol transferase
MFDFLHSFVPGATLAVLGPVKIYWYGLFVVLGVLAAVSVTAKLAKRAGLEGGKIFDLAFWLILGGLAGARLYHVLLELPYYSKYPGDIIKVWQGGLAIHGGIIAGLLILFFFCRKEKLNFWLLSGLMVPGIALGQAIGRWGNYFNQELYGLPTTLPWGIPIDLMHRPLQYLSAEYFHPTFLYESLGNLVIFGLLLALALRIADKKIANPKIALLSYLALYSTLRFFTEFLRIDHTTLVLGFRWPQILSAIIFLVSCSWLVLLLRKKAAGKTPS